jgi:hypothetical protein
MKRLKFIYSEKATKFCKISTLLLSYVVPVKSKVEISQNFAAFSEYMSFTRKWGNILGDTKGTIGGILREKLGEYSEINLGNTQGINEGNIWEIFREYLGNS